MQYDNMIQLAEIYHMPKQKTYLYVQCQIVVLHNVCNRTKRVCVYVHISLMLKLGLQDD